MPPGAKKRRALKKKKDLEASHNENPHEQQPDSDVSQIHGDDDLKHHDGKESEGDDVSSPASSDHASHQHQHQFNDGEKEEVEKINDSTRVQLLSEENKFTEGNQENGVAVEKASVDGAALSDRKSKTVGESNINDLTAEHAEAQKKSEVGVLSEIKDEESVIQIERENKLFEKLDDNDATVQDIEHEKGSSEGGLPLGNIGESHIIQDVEHEKGSIEGGLPLGNIGESRIIDKINVVVDNSPFDSSTEAADSLSQGLTQVLNPVSVGKLYGLVTEYGTDTVTDNAGSVSEKSIDTVTSGDSFVVDNASMHAIDENGKKEDYALDQKDNSLTNEKDTSFSDSCFENKKDESIIVTNDALGVSDEMNSATQENKEMSLSDVAPSNEATNRANASDGAEYVKYSEVPGSSVNQPLPGTVVHPVQRTSWLSCCGLLDLLAGSHR